MNTSHLISIAACALLLVVCLAPTSQAGIILNDAERTVCLHNVVPQLAKITVPSQVREVAQKAHYTGLGGYFLADIGGTATSFILEASKIAFMDILDDEQYLGACAKFNEQTAQFVYGYACAARTRYQDMMNQRILGPQNAVNEYTRLANACLFLILAHKDAKLSAQKQQS